MKRHISMPCILQNASVYHWLLGFRNSRRSEGGWNCRRKPLLDMTLMLISSQTKQTSLLLDSLSFGDFQDNLQGSSNYSSLWEAYWVAHQWVEFVSIILILMGGIRYRVCKYKPSRFLDFCSHLILPTKHFILWPYPFFIFIFKKNYIWYDSKELTSFSIVIKPSCFKTGI